MQVRVIATPGHTFTHLSYALADAATGEAVAVFTGGSLLHGSAGRPDLLGAEHAPALAAAQRTSLRRLAAELPDQAVVYPTHGFGSFCAATVSGADDSTIGEERRVNPALTLDEDSYVAGHARGPGRLSGLLRADGPGQRGRPGRPRLAAARRVRRRADQAAPRRGRVGRGPAQPAGVRGRAPARVAQLRVRRQPGGQPRLAAAPGHPADADRLQPRQVADAQRDLARIGIDRIAGMAGPPSEWPDGAPRLASYPVSDFDDLAAALREQPVVVLDVRRRLEWSGGHIEGALHVPLHQLPGRLPDLPPGPIWVHCQAGYRASVAASILNAAGRTSPPSTTTSAARRSPGCRSPPPRPPRRSNGGSFRHGGSPSGLRGAARQALQDLRPPEAPRCRARGRGASPRSRSPSAGRACNRGWRGWLPGR